MLFFSFFQHLVDRGANVTVELKNDLKISGAMRSVDQFLNVKIHSITLSDPEKLPHLLSVKNCFIRGSSVRYIHFSPDDVDLELLQDFCRKDQAPKNQQSGQGSRPEKKHKKNK